MKKSGERNTGRSFRLRAALLGLCLLAAALLPGCAGTHGEEPQEEAAHGRQMMQVFLDKHLPGAQVLSAEPCRDPIPGSLLSMKDCVKGEFSSEGRAYRYLIRTEGGQVYTTQFADGKTGNAGGLFSGTLAPYGTESLKDFIRFSSRPAVSLRVDLNESND